MPTRASSPGVKSELLDLAELRAAYSPESLRSLLARALDQFDQQQLLLDADIGRGVYGPAAEVLHQLKGTVSFFGIDADALSMLHQAEQALRMEEPLFVAAAWPVAQRILLAARQALTEQHAALGAE